MEQRRIDLVREGFLGIAAVAEPAARLFYRRLMETDPSTRSLFAETDMSAQGAKFIAALGMVVAALDRPATLLPKACEMARRHVDYGVRREHYASLGAALLWTLRHALGDAFTDDQYESWAEAYAILADAMMDAAYASQPVRTCFAA